MADARTCEVGETLSTLNFGPGKVLFGDRSSKSVETLLWKFFVWSQLVNF
jgi:hypothetical protein